MSPLKLRGITSDLSREDPVKLVSPLTGESMEWGPKVGQEPQRLSCQPNNDTFTQRLRLTTKSVSLNG